MKNMIFLTFIILSTNISMQKNHLINSETNIIKSRDLQEEFYDLIEEIERLENILEELAHIDTSMDQ